MNREEVKNIMSYLVDNYKNNFEITQSKKEYWCQELSQYDNEDITNRVKQLMSEDKYAYQPPLLEAITRGVTKKHNKVNFDELVYYCLFCKRPFNNKNELDKHEDRCSSVKYIQKQYKRFSWPKLTGTQIKEMYEMPEEEFDEKYRVILRKIQKLTNDESEKRRIEYIFNPPTQEEAKKFLNKEE